MVTVCLLAHKIGYDRTGQDREGKDKGKNPQFLLCTQPLCSIGDQRSAIHKCKPSQRRVSLIKIKTKDSAFCSFPLVCNSVTQRLCLPPEKWQRPDQSLCQKPMAYISPTPAYRKVLGQGMYLSACSPRVCFCGTLSAHRKTLNQQGYCFLPNTQTAQSFHTTSISFSNFGPGLTHRCVNSFPSKNCRAHLSTPRKACWVSRRLLPLQYMFISFSA